MNLKTIVATLLTGFCLTVHGQTRLGGVQYDVSSRRLTPSDLVITASSVTASNMISHARVFNVTPQTAIATYTSNSVIGTIYVLSGFDTNRVPYLHSCIITDTATNNANYAVKLFNQLPATGTYTDQSAPTYNTDVTNICGRVLTGNYTNSYAWDMESNLYTLSIPSADVDVPLVSTNLYLLIQAKSSMTTKTTNGLSFTLSFYY